MALIEWNPAVPNPQERFNQEAVFSLGGHELIDPAEQRGRVNAVTELAPISMANKNLPAGVQLYEISVLDPFVDADPVGYSIVREHVEKLENMVRDAGFDTLVERQKDHPY